MRKHTSAEKRRLGTVLIATPALLLTAVLGTASASTTATLGQNPGNQPLTQASSSCPSGSWVTGIRVGTEFSGVVDALGLTCTGGAPGSATLGTGTLDAGSSTCPARTTATGFRGRSGFALDAVGLRCQGREAGLAGGSGGGAAGPFDCAAGEALVGFRAGLGDYFGRPSLFTLTGLCAAHRATAKEQCKNGRWQDYGTRYKNQGDCVSDVTRQSKGRA